jgi:hypothetical protein
MIKYNKRVARFWACVSQVLTKMGGPIASIHFSHQLLYFDQSQSHNE